MKANLAKRIKIIKEKLPSSKTWERSNNWLYMALAEDSLLFDDQNHRMIKLCQNIMNKYFTKYAPHRSIIAKMGTDEFDNQASYEELLQLIHYMEVYAKNMALV